MGETLSHQLEPIAAWFSSLGIPSVIVHWGHPLMMGIVVVVMGSYVAYAGWRSRLTPNSEVAAKSRAEHRQLAPWLFLFIALGYTGGVLSLVVQQQPILESVHFWTGSLVLLLLTLNAVMALGGFGGEQKGIWRTIHAYLGGALMVLLVIHGILGLNLGLSFS